MKFKIKYWSFFFLGIILLISCGKKKSGTETLVPKDAKIVVSINAQLIMDKLSTNGFNVDDDKTFLKSLLDSTIMPQKLFSTQLNNSGIDFTQPIVIALSAPELGNKNAIFRIIAGIKNKDSLIKKLDFDKDKLEEGTINYVLEKEGNFPSMGFNNKYVVVIGTVPMDKVNKSSISDFIPVKNIEEMSVNQKRDLIKNTFHLTNSNSIVSNKDYNNLPIANNDIKIWTDQEFFIDNINSSSQSTQLVTRVFKDLFKGSSSTTLFNFDNGKINATNQMYFSQEAAEVIKNTKAQNIDLSLLNNFPGSTLNGVAGFSINPNMIYDFAKFVKGDGLLNLSLSEIKMSKEEVFDALSGDALVVVSDLTAEQINDKNTDGANMGMVVKIKDKAKLDKILSVPFFAKNISKEGDLYLIKMDSIGRKQYYMAMNNTVAVISPTKKIVTDYMSGVVKNTFDTAVLNKLKGKSAGYYYNIKSIGEMTEKVNMGQDAIFGKIGLIVKGVLGMFDDTYMTATNFKDNYIESNGVLNLKDNKQNSLTYMIRSAYKIMNSINNTRPKNASEIDLSNIKEEDDDRELPMQVK